MITRLRLGLVKWLDPKSIIFGVATFNFAVLWLEAHTMIGACVVCPWYYPWSYANEPTLLLVAASFLCIRRKWSYTLALGISGYLIGHLISLYVVYDLRPLEMPWASGESIIYEQQTQYLLAIVMLVLTGFYLVRALVSNHFSQARHPTKPCS